MRWAAQQCDKKTGAPRDDGIEENGINIYEKKKIRVTPEQWERVNEEAQQREISPNRLFIELVHVEAIECRECPRAKAEIYLLRSTMLAAQAGPRAQIGGSLMNVSERRSMTAIKPLRAGFCRTSG